MELIPLFEQLNGHGAEVVQGGLYGRRAAGDLPPLLIMAAVFAAGAVGTGFLNAMGADAWSTLKRLVGRAAATRRHDMPPSIILEIKFDDCEVILRPIADGPDLPERLDKAMSRPEEIGRAYARRGLRCTGNVLRPLNTGDASRRARCVGEQPVTLVREA